MSSIMSMADFAFGCITDHPYFSSASFSTLITTSALPGWGSLGSKSGIFNAIIGGSIFSFSFSFSFDRADFSVTILSALFLPVSVVVVVVAAAAAAAAVAAVAVVVVVVVVVDLAVGAIGVASFSLEISSSASVNAITSSSSSSSGFNKSITVGNVNFTVGRISDCSVVIPGFNGFFTGTF